MGRILAIKGTEVEREVDYSALSLKEIQKRIRGYEKQFGSYARFIKGYDCESSPPDDYLTRIHRECLLSDMKSRKGSGLSLINGGKRKPR